MKSHTHLKLQQGLTLIELMIAIVLGLLITAGMIELFVNSKQSYRVQENISRLQENGRFAMNFITQDIRMADYWGCLSSTTSIENNLNANTLFDGFNNAISGEDNNAAADNIIDGTDTIIVKGAFGSGTYVNNIPATTSADLKIEDNSGLSENDIVIVSDCTHGDIFQITNDPSTGGSSGFDNVVHNTGAVSSGPGNADKPFQKLYDTDAQLFNLKFAEYTIQTGSGSLPALYRTINGGTPQELIEGIENMQILYGEDTDNDKTPNYYLSANNPLLDMDRVVSVRVSLVVRTLEDNLAINPVPYTLFGTTVTPNDNVIRRVFSSTIAVRNRLP
jgi:type IV pilus assembly protein PilW